MILAAWVATGLVQFTMAPTLTSYSLLEAQFGRLTPTIDIMDGLSAASPGELAGGRHAFFW